MDKAAENSEHEQCDRDYKYDLGGTDGDARNASEAKQRRYQRYSEQCENEIQHGAPPREQLILRALFQHFSVVPGVKSLSRRMVPVTAITTTSASR
jgi:hypothetical protein